MAVFRFRDGKLPVFELSYRPGRVVSPEAVKSFVEQASAIASTFDSARRFTRASFA